MSQWQTCFRVRVWVGSFFLTLRILGMSGLGCQVATGVEAESERRVWCFNRVKIVRGGHIK